MATLARSSPHVVSRVAAATLGGYALAWSFAAFGAALGRAAGMAFGEASSLATMLALVLMLVAFCWAFAAASLARVWLGLAVASAAMAATAWLLARQLAA